MTTNGEKLEGSQVIRVYGTSVSSIKKDLETITGVNLGRKNLYTKETGRLTVTPEIFSSSDCCDPGGGCSGGGGSGEGELICLLIVAVVMALVAIVWTIVMIAFSILTIGGFLKRRYRTLVVIDRPNKEILGKLAVSVARRGGVMDYPLGNEEYDDWMRGTFTLHMRLKHLRQVSLFLAFGWGLVEVGHKLNQILFNPADYNLWPFRYVMIAIFLPLLLYGPVLEFKFNNAVEDVQELLIRILMDNPSYNPEYPMTFEEEPQIIGGMTVAAIRKLKRPPSDE